MIDPGSVAPVLDLLPDPVVVFDEQMHVVAANRRAVEFLGRTVAEFADRPPLELIHPDDLPVVLSSFEEVLGKEVGTPVEVRVLAADGAWRLCEVVGSTWRNPQGTWQLNAFRDITQRRRWEVAATDTARFRTIVESAAVVVLLLDAVGTIDSASGAMCRQLGHDPSVIVGSRLADWVVDDDRAAFSAAFARAMDRPGLSSIECRLRHKDGREIPYQFSVTNLLDDPIAAGVVLSGHDITGRRELEDRLAHLAAHDPLTGLANRALLEDFLEQCCAVASDDEPVGVLFVDLDRLKRVNDLYGHRTGDELIVAIARRLRALVRPEDLVARFGGDEFVMVCPGADPASTIPTLMDRIQRAIAIPVTVGGITLTVDASVGYVTARGGTSADVVLAEADDVMYQAKQARRGSPTEYRLGITAQRGLADDLRAALDGDPAAAGLELHYQPIVALPDARFVGAEALLRWTHPRLGRLGPGQFLPIAEDVGIDGPLGAWVLRGAIGQLAAWDATGVAAGMTMSVNVSASQIADPELEEAVWSMLAADALAPDRLCLEVAERQMLMRGSRRRRPTSSALRELAKRGITLAIDDFGTGFATLDRLREYPADVLKIDPRFVAAVGTDTTAAGIVAAVVALARATGMVTVAKGVETAAQADTLAQLGVDLAQGHYFGHPGPADGFTAAGIVRG